MTEVERLAMLRRHLDHLRALRPRVTGPGVLEEDLSLHNDVLFSLLTVAQLVIDIAGSLTASEGHPFEDYTEAVRNLKRLEGFPGEMVDRLARLPGFRNILVHDYVELDFDLVIQALHELEPVEDFVRRVATRLEGRGT